jgi:hypothetical protein
MMRDINTNEFNVFAGFSFELINVNGELPLFLRNWFVTWGVGGRGNGGSVCKRALTAGGRRFLQGDDKALAYWRHVLVPGVLFPP